MPSASLQARACGLLACLCFSAAAGGADAPPTEKVAAAGASLVLVRVKAAAVRATGTGFVVRVDPDAVYVATNDHVIEEALPADKRPFAPFGSWPPRPPARPVRVEVVFDSGGPNEQAAAAEPVAADEEYELAVLRVRGVKNPPRPVDLAPPAALTPASEVWVCGFPVEDAFAPAGRRPTARIGPASVSSVRKDEAGRVASVRLNTPVNPGKCGGPVFDGDGRLVGVAAAPPWGGKPGYVVPRDRLDQVLGGRVGNTRVRPVPFGAGYGMKITADLADPFRGVKPGTARVYALPADDWWDTLVRPVGGKWPPLPKAVRLPLTPTPNGMSASAVTPYRGRPTAVWVQTEWERADGTHARGAPVKHPWSWSPPRPTVPIAAAAPPLPDPADLAPPPKTPDPTLYSDPGPSGEAITSAEAEPDPPAGPEAVIPDPPAEDPPPVSVGPVVGATAAVVGVVILIVAALLVYVQLRRELGGRKG